MIFDSLSKSFCLTVPRAFVGEPFSVLLFSGTEKVWLRGGDMKLIHRKLFVSQCRN